MIIKAASSIVRIVVTFGNRNRRNQVNKLKKTTIILFSVLACVSLAACSNDKKTSDTKSTYSRSESIAKKSLKDKQSSIAESKKAVSESIESSKAESSSLAEESSSKAASSSMAAKLAETKSKLNQAAEVSSETEQTPKQQSSATPTTSSSSSQPPNIATTFEQDLQNLDIHQFINKYGETPVGYLIKNRRMSTKAALNMVPMEMKVSGEIQEGYLIQQGILDDYGNEIKK